MKMIGVTEYAENSLVELTQTTGLYLGHRVAEHYTWYGVGAIAVVVMLAVLVRWMVS